MSMDDVSDDDSDYSDDSSDGFYDSDVDENAIGADAEIIQLAVANKTTNEVIHYLSSGFG